MSEEPPPMPERDPYDDLEEPAETEPRCEWTPAEQDLAFRAQLILFIIMGIFIITPFILWWWLATHNH